MAEKITAETKKWINAVLQNDEASTDEELVNWFIEEGKLTEGMAYKAVFQRQKCLLDPHYSVGIKTIKL